MNPRTAGVALELAFVVCATYAWFQLVRIAIS